MKKVLLYLLPIVYTIAVIALNIILRTFSPLWYVWIALLWLGGFQLNKEKVWGGLLGLLPAVHLLYMSTQYTGQVINIEMPSGAVTALYVLGCSFLVWKQRSAKKARRRQINQMRFVEQSKSHVYILSDAV